MPLDRLINQLDTLFPFLALSREDIFDVLNLHRYTWFVEDEASLPVAYSIYRKQINHSAFLLGYSYLESFLTDLMANVLRNRPAMLPKNRKIDYSEILDSHDKGDLIDKLIKRELHDLLYKSMSGIITELRSRYNFTVTEEEKHRLVEGSLIRNCIMHNSSCADSRLASYDGYREGEEFELSTEDIHSFGLMLRKLVRRMYEEASEKHGVGVEQAAPPDGEKACRP